MFYNDSLISVDRTVRDNSHCAQVSNTPEF